MGLFDWFKSAPSNVTVLDDSIWLTKRAKLNGITQALSKRLQEADPSNVLILVAHFQDTLDELQQCIEKAGVSDSILTVNSAMLTSVTVSTVSFDETRSVQILVEEYHPLPSHDEAVMEFAISLPCRCCLVHYVSLEDPLIRAVCGELTENFLKRLGMAEDEVIESKLVGRQIKAAQKKFASQCLTESRLTESPADSAEMWIERNCANIWPKRQD